MSSPFRVLIVEDDQDACTNMVDILSLDGYEIRTASHCLPAIELMEREKFGAVVVDWKLPDGNGADLFPIVFENQPNTPVIVVTGLRDFDVAITALREGVYDFLLKPINADALRSVLKRVVERSRHLDEIAKAQSKLVQNERLAAIGEMMAGLAHESRNAFQKSHACLTNLAFDVREMPESLALVGKVQNALDHLNSLLEEVRDYAAPIVLEKSPTNLTGLVNEVWNQIVEANPDSKKVKLTLETADDVPAKTKVDRRRMGQVIWNLLENARVACDSDDGNIDVNVLKHDDNRDSGNAIEITIADNGDGIAAESRDEIFEPFFTTKTKGTGLGLAICQRIVNAHDGQIRLVDNNGHSGAKFSIVVRE